MDYSVQMGAVNVSQEELMQCTQRIQQHIQELEREANTSLNQWEGSVREFYHQKKREWDAAAAQMVQAASKAGVQLGHINSNYNQAERYGTNLWS
jgi:WXG100 family type VII secretion target